MRLTILGKRWLLRFCTLCLNRDARGNTVASSKVEELDPTNAAHVAQCEEWWG